MRTFQNNPLTTKDRGVSSLASHFMDLFDASKLETPLLRKRDLPTQDNLLQAEILKKLKTSPLTPSLQMPTLTSMLLNGTYPLNPLLTLLGQDQPFSSLTNLALLKQQQDLLSLQPLAFPNHLGLNLKSLVKNDKICVKEEHGKDEEHPINHDSPFKAGASENHTTNMSENSPMTTTELEMPDVNGAPALVEFTKAFPDWDLATIFNYLKSGKSKEVFEKEKQFRMERKMRRQRNKLANKEKSAVLKMKKVKGKKTSSNDEFRP